MARSHMTLSLSLEFERLVASPVGGSATSPSRLVSRILAVALFGGVVGSVASSGDSSAALIVRGSSAGGSATSAPKILLALRGGLLLLGLQAVNRSLHGLDLPLKRFSGTVCLCAYYPS